MKITDTNSLRASQEYLAAQEAGLAELLASIPPRKTARRLTLSIPYVNAILEVRAAIDEYLGLADLAPRPARVDTEELKRLATQHQKCVYCGERVRALINGEIDKVALQVTANECARIAIDVDDPEIRARALCALSLLDKDLSVELRRAMAISGEVSDG